MKLILHLVLKDLRAMRWRALAWAGFLAVVILVALTGYSISASSLPQAMLNSVLRFSTVVSCLFAFLVMIMLLYEDPATEPRAFWMTRPISGGMLALAKLTTFACLCLVPVLVDLPWWLTCNATPSMLLRKGVDAWELHMLAGLAAIPFALFARLGKEQLNKQVLLMLLMVLGFAALFFWLVRSDWIQAPSNSLKSSRTILALRIGIIFALGMGYIQFRTRRPLYGAVLGLCGLACILSALCFSPWDFTKHGIKALPAGPEQTMELQSFSPNSAGNLSIANIAVRLALPAGISSVSGHVLEGIWREAEVSVPVTGYVLYQTDETAARALALHQSLASGVFVENNVFLRSTDPKSLAALRKARSLAQASEAQLSFKFLGSYFNSELICDIPLKEGLNASADNYSLSITEVSESDTHVSVSIRQRGLHQGMAMNAFLVDRDSGWFQAFLPAMSSTLGPVQGVMVRDSRYIARKSKTPAREKLRVVVVNFPYKDTRLFTLDARIPLKATNR